MSSKGGTNPADATYGATAPLLSIAPTYKDAHTGALYVHQDLVQAQAPWAEEAHLPPVRASEKFGDVESWVDYVATHGANPDYQPFLTWNAAGLRAVLDYHGAGETGRCQWTAICPFVRSPEWRAWTGLADGKPVSHRAAIEQLEDLAPDIVEPVPADLMAILRSLRASVNAQASTELRADGSTNVSFSQDKKIAGGGSLDLPPEFTIGIRVLTGHVGDDGRPVLYRLPVRVRVTVGDDAKLALRFSIPIAERVLEEVYADRVAAAKRLLGDGYTLLRAAD